MNNNARRIFTGHDQRPATRWCGTSFCSGRAWGPQLTSNNDLKTVKVHSVALIGTKARVVTRRQVEVVGTTPTCMLYRPKHGAQGAIHRVVFACSSCDRKPLLQLFDKIISNRGYAVGHAVNNQKISLAILTEATRPMRHEPSCIPTRFTWPNLRVNTITAAIVSTPVLSTYNLAQLHRNRCSTAFFRLYLGRCVAGSPVWQGRSNHHHRHHYSDDHGDNHHK